MVAGFDLVQFDPFRTTKLISKINPIYKTDPN
jgi:hypothetical protein